ncbi:MAG TPA: hypothetical protein VKU94_07705 [Geobacterales bacterium]|nr:hypothetical protein [Geobacterales bacterium]
MIKLDSFEFEIKEIKKKTEQEVVAQKEKQQIAPLERPYCLDGKIYKLKSRFVAHSIFITIGYIKDGNKVRPFEIFINSKDLSRAAEFTMLTRLLSAIFRRFEDPVFILEELRSVYDPNRIGYWITLDEKGEKRRYIHSLYGEIAEVIEQFFREMGIMKDSDYQMSENVFQSNTEIQVKPKFEELDLQEKAKGDGTIEELNLFQICPVCNLRTLKIEGGCYTCINPECGYTRCG